MNALFASISVDLILFFVFAVALTAWLVFDARARSRPRAGPPAPILYFDVVYPNGLRKAIEARTAEEATELVAGDTSLRHDVVLYYPGGRIAGVVRPRVAVWPGDDERFDRVWFPPG
jgi:hypothetical protein